MQRERIASKLMKSIGYDPATKTLEVEFLENKSGQRKVYRYLDVPPEKWELLQKADSKGGYFLVFIKRNYVCERVEDETQTKERLETSTTEFSPADPEASSSQEDPEKTQG